MLQLTLEQGEYVMVGDNVKVSYDRLGSNKQLVLTFDAPKDVKILRQRVHEESLVKEAGLDTLEGRRLSEQFRQAREEKERAAQLRSDKMKERNRAKKEQRKAERESRPKLQVVGN